MEGMSMVYSFNDALGEIAYTVQYAESAGNRNLRDGWHAQQLCTK
jgi:hypothetical protein